MENTDHDFEQFPAMKKQIRQEEPPELIFFDVDEYSEEADFIRVDDLFREEAGAAEKLTGWLTFTFIPKKSENLINSRISRQIQRCLLMSAVRLERPLDKVRIRPRFVQFQTELRADDPTEVIAREFRDDLEDTVCFSHVYQNKERFWSANCFVSPADRDFSDEFIVQAVSAGRNRETETRS